MNLFYTQDYFNTHFGIVLIFEKVYYFYFKTDSRKSLVHLKHVSKHPSTLIRYDTIIDSVFPRWVINRWPPIILAVNRMAKVPGRVMFLMVSIHTIKVLS